MHEKGRDLMRDKRKNNIKTMDMVYISIFSVLIVICAWVSIPMTVPFTMQTFGVFCALGVLGGMKGTISVAVYILLGVVGIPVFSNFKGGVGALFGATGGYILGFILMCLIYWVITKVLGDKTWVKVVSMTLGLIVCYAFGTAWFMYLYAKTHSPIGIMSTLGLCVFPFVIPDFIKMGLAIYLSNILKKHIKLK